MHQRLLQNRITHLCMTDSERTPLYLLHPKGCEIFTVWNQYTERLIGYSTNITNIEFREENDKQLLESVLTDVATVRNIQITQLTAVLDDSHSKLTR